MRQAKIESGSSLDVAPKKKPVRALKKSKGAVDLGEVVSDPERDERIRQTAYSFYEARHRVDGYAQEDWLKAEAEVEVGQERAD